MSTDEGDERKSSVIEEVWREFTAPRMFGFSLTIAISTVLMGPFNTFSSMQFAERAIFWPGLVFVCVLIGLFLIVLGRRLAPETSAWITIPIQGAVVGLLVVPVVLIWAPLVVGSDYVFRLTPVETWAAAFVSFSMVATTLRIPAGEMDENTEPEATRPRLYRRLPDNAKGDVIHLTVDDHYVEVTMSDGTRHRLLLRLADAVEEMGGVDGFCVHRSHWVARAAIQSVYREKGRDFVKLKTGTEVPVSRTYRPNLVRAGLLEPRD